MTSPHHPEDAPVADTDVAIVGMAGRFPGADDLDAFWQLLSEGREGITRFSREELAAAGVPDRLLDDPAYVPAHGVIPDVDLFDTGYFELTPSEAAMTDPQHRLLLTAGHAALEHAGYDPSRYDGLISVYAGAAINTYLQQQVLPRVDQTVTSNHFAVMVGNDKDFLATRLSYKLDLKGPSYAVQTACSTSLVAIHLACQGLINGECDMALAGGVTVKLPQTRGYLYEEGAILSPDGHVRAFDAEAGGTVLGNGVGVLVLKPLRDALADRDTVHAVIKGTATNNDGSDKVSFAAPGAAGQTAAIREAHAVSGVDPRTISYVETHGTGTRLGDPVEVSALTKAFRAATDDTGFCAIGSVKSNVGHLDAAAGVAGVIKTALMMKHRTLVPTLNYHEPNPAIDFAAGPFEVSSATAPWNAGGPLRAGVSSFGIGGTNAHAVLEEAPATAATGDSRPAQVLVLSARTPTALRTAAGRLAAHLEAEDDRETGAAPLADVAHTLAVGRKAHEYRLAVCGDDRRGLAEALREAEIPERPATGGIAFVFTEHVADAAALAQEWSAAEPAFAAHHEAAMAAGAGEHGERGDTFALQYALGRLWLDWGLRPDAVHGDGAAALAAACVTGTLTLETATARLADADTDADNSETHADAAADADADSGAADAASAAGPHIPLRGAQDEVRGVALETAHGPWEAVARAWAAGAAIDWAAWFAGQERARVPLPTYPFEGRRCWIEGRAGDLLPAADPLTPGTGDAEAAHTPSGQGPHPMLDENVSTLDTLAYRSTRTGDEFYLADHRVGGEPVMPAVAYLELARAAGGLATGGTVRLRDVSFDRPLSFASGPRTALVGLWGDDSDGIGFEVTEGEHVHATGTLHTDSPTDTHTDSRTAEAPAAADPSAVAARCPEVLDGPACYDLLRRRGLDYGPRMRALTEVALGEHEALATLRLPDGAALDGARLNPAVLDGALHAVVALLAGAYGEAAGGFLPMALGELAVYGPVTGACRAHVTVGRLAERAAHAEVTLLDTEGRPLARLGDLTVRVLPRTDGAELMARDWTATPAEHAGHTGAAVTTGAVVAADASRRTALAGLLTSLGAEDVTTLAPGAEDELTAVPDAVLVDEPGPRDALRLVQRLLHHRPTSPVRVLLIHRHDADGALPERAALGGFARTVRAENPLLELQVVGLGPDIPATGEADLPDGTDPAGASGEAAALAAELAGPGRETEVRYTGTARQTPHAVPAPATEPAPVRPDGVYVITGGAGGLGRLVAGRLLERAAGRVVLLGRGEDPDGDDAAQRDERIAYRRADVTDAEALDACLAAVREEFGPLNGVVHAAGVLRDGFALTKTAADLDAVLAPKTDGLRALLDATTDDPLDFFVAFSSIAAHIGSAGQADYAYANAFLEAYAERVPGLTAVAWPLWAEGGMRQSADATARITARTGFGVLPTATGLDLFEQALGTPGALVAAYGDTAAITTALAAPAPTAAGTARPTGEGDSSEDGTAATGAGADDDGQAYARALALLRELIAAETGLEPAELTEDTPFDRYGIDSLRITKLNAELDRHFTGLSKTLFFEYATLGELAGHFAEHHASELAGTPGDNAHPAPGTSPGAEAHTGAHTDGAPRAPRTPRTLRRTRGATVAARPAPGTSRDGAPGDDAPEDDQRIAVIGIAGRYPMADDVDEFWRNLLEGRDCITEIPEDRWDRDRWYDPDPAAPGRAHTRWGGFLRDVDRFDPLFFGISPRQAELMDPQERLFLQNTWHALEDAGYRRTDLSGRPVGVYVGVMYGEYQFQGAVDVLRGGRPLTGSSFASIANRVSHQFDLSGPSLALDTMCSSSLTAIHLACESLRHGESELAIAGGVNVSVHPYKYAFLSQGRYLSSDGRCRSFGEGGDGYVPGEGVGAVLLKPYRQALADGDRIHGVILGSAVNHGARTNGYTVPSPRAQARVIGAAMEQAGLAPEQIGYVEAHGTGTALGDPIELTGLTTAYGTAPETPGHWPIGSVKSNIGHLESAAGMAGLTKTLLQFTHRTLVPSLHSEQLNPNIDFSRSPFRVQRERAAWTGGDEPRRAGLSSFGAGGANAHLVLEESPRPDPAAGAPAAEQSAAEPVAFLLSARDEERLRGYAERAARFLESEHVPLTDLCYTTQVGRETLDVRLAVLDTDGAGIVAALRRFAEGGPLPEVSGDGALAERARAWLAGDPVDWAAWHASRPGPAPRRVRAPHYPFAPERHWVPLDPGPLAEPGGAPLHPLVDANESTVAEVRFRKTLRAADPLLRDHVIEERGILAGAATLAFVAAAARLAEPGTRHALRDVLWGRPVEPAAGGTALYVSFRREPGGPDALAFEVYSETGAGRVTHARGSAAPDPGPRTGTAVSDDAVGAVDAVDIEALRSRLPVLADKDTAYADYHAAGFAYGPSFQVIEEVRGGSEEALLRLRGEGAGPDDTVPPPALLDGALRACHWVGRTEPFRAGELAVPFSLDELVMSAPLPAVCYAHARLVGEARGVRRFDLTVLDEQGRALATLRDFAGRPPAGTTAAGTAGEAGGVEEVEAAEKNAEKNAEENAGENKARFHEPYWRTDPAPEPGPAAPTLALLGELPGLEEELTRTGTWSRVVHLPDAVADADGADGADGLAERLAELAGPEGLDLVLAPAAAPSPATGPDAETDASAVDTLERTCSALLDVLTATASGALPGRVRCALVHPQDDGADRPEHAAVAGFARSTAATAPRLELLTLGVPAGTSAAELASAVAVELRAAPRAGGLEVRRTADGDRQVRALRPFEEPAAGPAEPALRERGVYVITGGRGAIGGVLAGHLARAHRARLVLIGRTAPDAGTLRSLTDQGAEVLALRADVARSDELATALDAARERFGTLHGVFHLAGVGDDGRASDGDRQRFARVLAPKTRGLVQLDRLTRDDALDLFVVFSSVSSLLGDFGAASYATANRFADLFTARRDSLVRAGSRHGRSLSLAWPLWSVGGVDALVSEDELAAYTRRSGMRALTAEQGLDAFERALSTTAPWLLPVFGDAATVDAAPAGPGAQPAPATPRAGSPAASGDGLRSRLVEHLRGVLAGVLKLAPERLDHRTPLDAYGLDSVLIMESNTVLGKDFPGLRGTVFFEYRTVDDLADHLLAEHRDAVTALLPEPAAPRTPAGEPSTGREPSAPTGQSAAAGTAPRDTRRNSEARRNGEAHEDRAAREDDEPIAVVGVSGRYPGARDLDEFWDNLVAGRDCVTGIPAERWDADALFDPDPSTPGRSYSRWGGFLSDVDAFDSLFFQISPKQARSMDPQERLFLETAWSALENAGYPPSRIPAPKFGGQGHDAGVFVGVMWDDYAVLAATESARGNHQSVLANRSSIANQVSYAGDFRGPSVVVDTACSASLVAVHQACESIRRGECSYAVAGGVNVSVHPDKYVHLSRRNMLSTDGRCRAFGADGSGYVPGEGVGAVVLKRLSEAVRDGDTVHAVIRATAVNHGGRTSGFTVPNPHAQQALVEQALASAGIDARTIGYVEAHGTGTALGDPIEHTGLAQAFAGHTADTGFCALGSVKSSVGHLEGAAGIAGLTKAVLQLRHGTLVPTLHAEELNPVIDFSRSPFTVQRETAPWPRERAADGAELPRRAAVSSFGAGGTNAHVILEEYVPPRPPADTPGEPELIVLSARDADRLREYAAELGRILAEPTGPQPLRLADVAYTLRVGREPLAERLAFVAHDLTEAAELFTAAGRGESGPRLHRGTVGQHPPLGGLFTDGVGGQDFLTAQITAGGDDLLARLWASGVTVDWELLHRLRPATRLRVPLPTYPFERARHWLDIPDRPADALPGTAPALAAAPPGDVALTLAADAPALRDHIVEGRPLLPGVGHLDLVAGARDHRDTAAFTDVRWIAPLTADGERTPVRIRLTTEAGQEHYQVLGADGTVRSRGRLAEAAGPPAPVDVAQLTTRLDSGPEHDAFYRQLDEQGLPYGPFYRRVRQVWTGENEVLGRIGAGTGTEDVAHHHLHPGVLDAALHTVAALLVRRRGTQAPPMLPFAADRVDVFGPVPDSGWSHITGTGQDRWDVLLTDEHGTVRVRFTGLVYREAKPAAVAGYRPAWTDRPAEDTAPAAHSVLLVAEQPGSGPASALARQHPQARIRRLTVGPDGLAEAALDAALAEPGGYDLVYFVATAPEQEPDGPAALRTAADRGVIALYRLVRALDRHGLLAAGLRLKVVTTGVHPLEHGEDATPWPAGPGGVAMVLAKEYPQLKVALVDVRAAEADASAPLVAAEPFPARTAPVSLRGGVRRVRTLERVTLPQNGSRFRQGGVYLVVGGLGAVGRDTCRHLARTYGAALVVVGRSPLDDERRAAVAEFEAAGARVRYLALDATDPAALAEAVRVAKREFGALHGVINAAMVLVNQVLRELPEAQLRAALDAKTHTTWGLLHAVRDEPLDFALMYSSAVVFEGNHGQAGYAAGCSFADAYALHAARTLPFPVRVLNLGYWHAGGDEDRERVLHRVRAAGIRPLTARAGMAAVEQVLAADLPQLLALDAEPRILDNLGVTQGQALTVLPGSAPDTPPRVGFAAETDRALAGHQAAVAEAEELAPRLLAAALRPTGLFEQAARGQGPRDAQDLAAAVGVVPEHTALFAAQLALLADSGHLHAAGERYESAGRPAGTWAEEARAADELIARHPGIEPVVALLRDCLAALPDVLTGRREATDVLFPEGSQERVAAVYRGDPVTDRCNAETARLVVAQVRARLAAEPGARVRVLEVGAGTGGTSAAVLAALAPYGASVDYVFTDVSPAFVRKGRARFGADHPFARFETLDIESDPAAGDMPVGSCDVVFGTNVFHATRRLTQTLTHAKRLLRRGGVLLLTEGTRPLSQLALVFGLTSGWWRFADPGLRMPHSPLATERQWRDALATCGFTDIDAGAPTSQEGPAFQSVIAAVSDGVVAAGTNANPPAAPAPGPAPGTARSTAGAPAPVPAGPAPATAGEDDALEQVTAVFARVLEMPPERLDPDLTFENYGVDSLVVLDLTKRLEEVYGPLPTTLLFERITIGQLAEFFRTRTAPHAAAPAHDRPRPQASAPAREPQQEPEPPAGPAGSGGVEGLVSGLSDEEVAGLLAELLPDDRESEGGDR
ncbi:SDR family NAD(P)-dependent oxidoreductase [Streptomyces cacaoi]|uniref:SDR family NAD(P)-dependent oxidoreductase n=1 Tax=Streptomyces cacaoi TaxID=1898 RepID=UPI001FD00175|nr:SDR family NAD(P)-dependent oxidoreductase [Streptomyces cacaoi]